MTTLRQSPSGPFVPVGSIDITSAPYNAVAGDPKQADHNTAAINQARADARRNGLELTAPGGTFYIASNGLGPDANGFSSCILVGGSNDGTGDAEDSPLVFRGAGRYNTIFQYVWSERDEGQSVALIHRWEGADVDSHPLNWCQITGMCLQGSDPSAGKLCDFGVKLRHVPLLVFEDGYARGFRIGAHCLDLCYGTSLKDIVSGDSYIGKILGAYAGANHGMVLTSCGETGCTIGRILCDSKSVSFIEGSPQYNPGVGSIFSHVEGVYDKSYYENNGVTYSGGFTRTGILVSGQNIACDVIPFRGTISKTTVPWVFTFVSNSDGAANYDPAYNNRGLVLAGTTALNPLCDAFAVGNAYDGLRFTDLVKDVTGGPTPLFQYLADGAKGIMMPFTVDANVSGFGACRPWGGAVAFGAVNLPTVANAKIAGVPVANLIGPDTLGSLDIRFLSGETPATSGSLKYSVTENYNDQPVLNFVGGAKAVGVGLVIDPAKSPNLAGKVMVIACRGKNDGTVANMPVMSVAGQGVSFGVGDYNVTGWQVRSSVFQVPVDTPIEVGFSTISATTGPFTDLAIFELGAGYEDVVAATRAARVPGLRITDFRHDFFSVVDNTAITTNGDHVIAGAPIIVANIGNVTTLAVGPGSPGLLFTGVQAAGVFGAGGQLAPAVEYRATDYIPACDLSRPVWVEAIYSGRTYLGGNQMGLCGYYSGDLSGATNKGAGTVLGPGLNGAATLQVARCKYVAGGTVTVADSTPYLSDASDACMFLAETDAATGRPRPYYQAIDYPAHYTRPVAESQAACNAPAVAGACNGATTQGLRFLVGGEAGGNTGFARFSFGHVLGGKS